MTYATLEAAVKRAKSGDEAALEEVVRQIQDKVYGLALRMLWHPADAEDASQEILVKIITRLASFRGDSGFTTWVYRVAANHLLTTRRRRAEQERIQFTQFAEALEEGLAQELPIPPTDVEQNLLVEEAKIGCMQGMLLCLDREQRITYILGEILELKSPEGAEILGISEEAFRQRLARGRSRLRRFMHRRCGLANPSNPCRCERQVGANLANGRIQADRLLFAGHPVGKPSRRRLLYRVQEMDEVERIAALFKSHPDYAAPPSFLDAIRSLVDSSPFRRLVQPPESG